MNCIESLLATPDQFRAWLEQQPRDRRIGECIHPEKCPLAEFLAAHLDYDYISVGKYNVDYGPDFTNPQLVGNPYWMRRFVYEVDSSGRAYMTVGECLRLLEHIDLEVAA